MTTERSMTIVIHLPQQMDKVVRVLQALAKEWPDASFKTDLTRLEIPADEP